MSFTSVDGDPATELANSRTARIAATLLAVHASWMLFDGVRAMTVGDYVTPASGPHAGQLGPWSHLVRACGLDPRSPPIKAVHVLLGLLGWAGVMNLLRRTPRTQLAVVTATLSLWYLPTGTVLCAMALNLLLRRRPRTPEA